MGLNCRIDTRSDEGLQSSDHFCSRRLSLKRRPLSRLRRGGGSFVILMPCIVPRWEAEQKAREASERRQRNGEEKAQTRCKKRVDGTRSCLAKETLPIKKKKKRKLNAVPLPVLASCLSTAANVNPKPTLVHTRRDADKHAHIRLCLQGGLSPIPT